MVTAETAMVLPVLVLLSLVGVAAVGVAQARVRCADGAREAARAVARGEVGSALARATAAAGRPVTVSTTSQGAADTTVTVRMRLRLIGHLGEVSVTETATVATEPGSVR